MRKHSLADWIFRDYVRSPLSFQQLFDAWLDDPSPQNESALTRAFFPRLYQLARNWNQKCQQIDVEDFFSAGCLGLARALRHYRPRSEGVAFPVYAFFSVKQAMSSEAKAKRININKWGDRQTLTLGEGVAIDQRQPLDVLEEREAAKLLEILPAAVARLPNDDRRLLELQMSGISVRAAGQALGWPNSTTWVRYRRAIRRLRELYYQPRREASLARCYCACEKQRNMIKVIKTI